MPGRKLSGRKKILLDLSTNFFWGGYAHRVLAFKVADMTANFGNLLRANRGFFSRAEAIDSGETDRTLATARREGVIVRLRRGMYAPPTATRQAMTLVSIFSMPRAALAAQRGEVALTGPPAAALHGFALHDQDLAMVHLAAWIAGAHTSQPRPITMSSPKTSKTTSESSTARSNTKSSYVQTKPLRTASFARRSGKTLCVPICGG
jgi:Transcriptional regulator, AbiEi antitoxin